MNKEIGLLFQKKITYAFLGAAIFFILQIITIHDYGISWDETLHFRRGQAYLYYFLTGQTTYKLHLFDLQGTNGNPVNIPVPRRSFYQNDYHNGVFFLKDDIGHPPLNDIMAAFLNFIFFQKMGLVDDISAHHLFNILASSLLVFIVVYWMLQTFGKFAALISFLTLLTYPLFFAEAHFNIKDPPEAAFFAATLWSFYQMTVKKRIRWLIATIIFFSLALGTKFNILFSPFIFIPYILINYRTKIFNLNKKILLKNRNFLIISLFSPLVVVIILVTSWPFLRQDVIGNFMKVLDYYRQIGSGSNYQSNSFYIFGFNTFPLQWIIFTSPPLALLLSAVGLFSSFLNRKRYFGVSTLWTLWLIIPIVRVTLPSASIYGGIRQIMEFLPALSLLSGLGAWQLIDWLKSSKKKSVFKINLIKQLMYLITIVCFIWPVYQIIRLHPYQNVYFNFLIGGLEGAKNKNFPSWGNTFGSAYLEGIKWINQTAPKDAKVSLIQGTLANAPLIYFRPDIIYKKDNFSGMKIEGEYLMELTYNDTSLANKETWDYVQKYLKPVYEVKIDNVSVLTIWKNDKNNLKIKSN